MIFLEFLLFKEMKMSWSPIILWQIGKRQIVGVGDDCLESFRVWSPIRSEDDILETTEVKGQKMNFGYHCGERSEDDILKSTAVRDEVHSVAEVFLVPLYVFWGNPRGALK